mmetsp:Transcript_7626/g.14206  ORF Transcript_7626/g.14206 Transcript_7626/m.14206 type:complete len:159 (+) Transcript_7626:424-900(+)
MRREQEDCTFSGRVSTSGGKNVWGGGHDELRGGSGGWWRKNMRCMRRGQEWHTRHIEMVLTLASASLMAIVPHALSEDSCHHACPSSEGTESFNASHQCVVVAFSTRNGFFVVKASVVAGHLEADPSTILVVNPMFPAISPQIDIPLNILRFSCHLVQ